MDALLELSVLLLLGWASGFSLYLTVALAGLASRFGWLVLPGNLEILEHPLVIGLALFMYALEFVADKIPLVDSAWDSVHTLIRPTGAAAVGYLAGTDYGPLAQTALAVATGTIALDMHAVKASTRAAVNTSPEPVSNIAVSTAEDAAVVGAFWLYTQHPVLATVVLVLTLVGSFFVLRALWRFVLKLFKPRQQHAEGQ